MELKGKKITFLGDSITEGANASSIENAYWSRVGALTGATVIGMGIGGTRITPQINKETDAYDSKNFQVRMKDIPKDSDVIVVFGGTNDFGHGDAPLGFFGDTDTKTFYGAFYTLIKYLLENHPTARLVVMTPLHRLGEDSGLNEFGNPTDNLLIDYVNAEKEICEYFSIPVLDLWNLSGMQPALPIMNETFMGDGLHPNDKGHCRIASLLTNFLKNL